MTQPRNRHIIKKQIFEVEVKGQEKAWDIQQKLGEIFQKQVLPALNQALNKLSPPNVIHRIDQLEIDLGKIRLDHLEEDVTQVVQKVIQQSFQKVLPKADIHPNELLGQLDSLSLDLNKQQLEDLEKDWWQKLKTTFRKWLNEDSNALSLNAMLKKIDAIQATNELENKILKQFKALVQSKWDRIDTDNRLDKLVEEIKEEETLNQLEKDIAQKLKLAFKQALLKQGSTQLTDILQLVDTLELDDNLEDFERDLIPHLKTVLKQQIQQKWGSNQASSSLVELLIYFLDTGRLPWWAKPNPKLLDQALENAFLHHPTWLIDQFKKYSRYDTYRKRIINSFQNEELWQLSQQVLPRPSTKTANPLVQGLIQALPEMAQKLSISSNQVRFLFWEQVLLTFSEPPSSERFNPLLLQNLSLSLAKHASPKEVNTLLDTVLENRNLKISWQANLALQPTKPSQSSEQKQAPVQKQFSQSEEIYVDNAGLVLLWIFFSNFFKNLDWLEDKSFKSPFEQHRATWMLQYLATGQTTFPEYELPLNKVLCGLHVNQSLGPLEALTEEEQTAGDQLLEVVLSYAQGLGNLSKEGFQQAYLQREGVLTRQNNGYLLQVEKETFDILLTRLEWTYQIVKLPWMDQAIFVEW
ncbi:MAG TPA: hypothetical protein DCS93_36610 [Microscillaceae bacterium]|nr:hypothetical protein [Microscillaceae bacterium]